MQHVESLSTVGSMVPGRWGGTGVRFPASITHCMHSSAIMNGKLTGLLHLDGALACAGLWRALVFGDAEGIKQHAAAMNAADSYAFFASMLTMRPWEEITK